MKRLLFVFSLALALMIPSSVAIAGETGDWWSDLSHSAMEKFLDTDDSVKNFSSLKYGMATGAAANLYGWDDPRTLDLLNKLRATRNPDGSYGVSFAYDVGKDGSANSATAGYVVTMTSHVGFTLLDGYKAGVVSRDEVQSIVTMLVRWPRVSVPVGQCLAYSNSKNDTNRCVHNINAGAAHFLMEANREGFAATGLHKLITDITLFTAVRYRSPNAWWPYYDNTEDQDSDHQSYTAESMYNLAYFIGREAAYQQMTKAYTDISTAPLVHIRLTGLQGGVGSWSSTDPSVTIWCEMGNRWRSEAQNYLNTSTDPKRTAQIAYYGSRNIKACENN